MSEVTGSTAAAPTPEGASSEVSNQQDSGSKPEAAKELTTAQKEKFKLLVDGEEIEEEVDFSDKEGLKKRLQLAHAAKKRMSEAQDAKKKAFQIVKEFEENPESMLARLGPKGREIAEKFLLSQIQDEMLSPEEKEFRDLKKYKEMTEAEKDKVKEALEREAATKIESDYAKRYQDTIIEAMEKSGLPKTPELVKRMAGIMKKNLEYGLDLSPDDLIAEVKSDITNLVKSVFGDADGDQLINIFGKDIANKIRKADLKKLQEKQSQLFQKPKAQGSSSGKNEARPKSIEEWKQEVEDRLKRG